MGQADIILVAKIERGGQQGLEPHGTESGGSESLSLGVGALRFMAGTITSIAPLATPSTMAARSDSERSGGFTLRKV